MGRIDKIAVEIESAHSFKKLKALVAIGYILCFLLLIDNMLSGLLSCFLLTMVIIEWNKNIKYKYSDSWEDKARKELGTEFVTIKIRDKNTKKKVVGGFAIPLMPAKVWIYENEKLPEIIVHEMAHIKFMIHGFQIFFLFMLLVSSSIIANLLGLPGYYITVPILFFWMITQEYYAFTTTKRYMAKFGYEANTFSKKTVLKYSIIFASVIAIGALIYWLCELLKVPEGWISGITFVIVFLVYQFAFDKIFYNVFKKIGK